MARSSRPAIKAKSADRRKPEKESNKKIPIRGHVNTTSESCNPSSYVRSAQTVEAILEDSRNTAILRGDEDLIRLYTNLLMDECCRSESDLFEGTGEQSKGSAI